MEAIPRNDSGLWRTGCFILDRECTFFATRATFSLVVIFFCVFQLITKVDCNSQSLYIGVLTTIMGVWLPAPSFPNKR